MQGQGICINMRLRHSCAKSKLFLVWLHSIIELNSLIKNMKSLFVLVIILLFLGFSPETDARITVWNTFFNTFHWIINLITKGLRNYIYQKWSTEKSGAFSYIGHIRSRWRKKNSFYPVYAEITQVPLKEGARSRCF